MASSSKQTEVALPNLVLKHISSGPLLCHHVGVIIGSNMYVHGGLSDKGSTHPLNHLYKMDLESKTWEKIDKPSSPALSHHAAVVLKGHYMVTIGGWDGHSRTSDLYAFDTDKQQWTFLRVSGFPIGAGLSSHTANVLENGDILVVGREGSLRMQRRSGNAFLLSGDVKKGSFKYSDYPMGVASRSGHTSTIVGSRIVIIGGRNDKILEQHAGYHNTSQKLPNVLTQLVEVTKHQTAMSKPPCGRKNQVAIPCKNAILLHGGETFDGRSRYPVGEMFLIRTQPHLAWYKLGTSLVDREGHICCWNENIVIFHGGSGIKNTVFSDTYELVLQNK